MHSTVLVTCHFWNVLHFGNDIFILTKSKLFLNTIASDTAVVQKKVMLATVPLVHNNNNKAKQTCADKYFCFLLSFEDFIILVQPFL